MDLFSELITAVQSDLTIGDESSLFPLDTVKLAINRSYRKIGGLYRWPELEDAKKTSTQANVEYYDYPDSWQPDSIWKLRVDGQDYGSPLAFKDYLYEQENDNPSGQQYMWSNQWRRYFIDPTPTTSGSLNIEVWGQKIVDKLVNNSDVTIFSYSMADVNEAIVLEAREILKLKGEDSQNQGMLSPGAIQLVTGAWNKIRENQSKYHKTKAMFVVPDFYARGRNKIKNTIGDFN